MKDTLGNRMKENYENRYKYKLCRRIPAIIRLDGKAFHTFTKGFEKPFDSVMVKAMQDTMKYLCKNIQGCVFGYTQSDEITLVLIDYLNLNSDAWFDYNIQKMCSVSASMATLVFQNYFEDFSGEVDLDSDKGLSLSAAYIEALNKGAMFDARCFNIPKEEVANCILWRQQDATRNSIFSLGRAYFSHKELQGLKSNEIQNKLFTEKNINWNDLPVHLKRGSCCYKVDDKWIIDENMPIISEDPSFIDKLVIL